MKIYKVISSDKGFKELELKVSQLLNKGWICVGGIAFNMGHSYQAMMREEEEKSSETRQLTANEAFKRLDDLT